MSPARLHFSATIGTLAGSHPPALREAIFDFDKNGSIDATGLPVCGRRQIEGEVTGSARRACGDAIVGGGIAAILIEQVEAPPVPASARLTLFNGGVRDGVTRLFIHATLGLPQPVSVVAPIEIRRIAKERYGWTSIVKIPELFDGSGSLTSFDVWVGRRFALDGTQHSYLTARCFDGTLAAAMLGAAFRETTTRSITTLLGTLYAPCTPRD